MKSKFKDLLFYSLACVGAISMFLSAHQPQQKISTVPESHVWEFSEMAAVSGRPKIYKLNKVTGEVILYEGEKVQPLK